MAAPSRAEWRSSLGAHRRRAASRRHAAMPPRSLCELSASAAAIPVAAAGSVGSDVTATRNHVGLSVQTPGSRPHIAALLAAQSDPIWHICRSLRASNWSISSGRLAQHGATGRARGILQHAQYFPHLVPLGSLCLAMLPFFQPTGPVDAKFGLLLLAMISHIANVPLATLPVADRHGTFPITPLSSRTGWPETLLGWSTGRSTCSESHKNPRPLVGGHPRIFVLLIHT